VADQLAEVEAKHSALTARAHHRAERAAGWLNPYLLLLMLPIPASTSARS
jgi:hypothetical protein